MVYQFEYESNGSTHKRSVTANSQEEAVTKFKDQLEDLHSMQEVEHQGNFEMPEFWISEVWSDNR